MTTLPELNTRDTPTWCPGCGNYPLMLTLKNSLVELGFERHETLIVAGIGCHGHLPQWVNVYGFQGIHGRALPFATAAKLANHALHVIVVMGDGDCYGIGMNHFIQACRRNVDVTAIVHDNMVYGLTTGQYSPTSERGYVSKSSPFGSLEAPINPLALAMDAGATYVARGFSGDVKHLQKLFTDGIRHRGFSLVDVLQPCVTFNKINTYESWQKRCYKLETAGHDAGDKKAAWLKAGEWGERVPIGLFYKTEAPAFQDRIPQLVKGPLVKQPLDADVATLIDEFC